MLTRIVTYQAHGIAILWVALAEGVIVAALVGLLWVVDRRRRGLGQERLAQVAEYGRPAEAAEARSRNGY